MTMTNATTDLDAALAAAVAVVRCLPADLNPGAALVGPESLESAINTPGSKAVSATLSGAVTGTLVVILSPDMAAQVENGPVGPQELVAGLEPALTDATAALGASFGELRFEAPLALDAEVALANGASFEGITVVPLTSSAGPVASLVVLINRSDTSPGEQATVGDQAHFQTLSPTLATGLAARGVELLNDVEMGVTAELGRTRMTVRELLAMQPGSVVELDRAAGSPVDLLVNGTLVARGEVVVIDEEFGVRITEIIGYDAKKNGK